LFAEYTPVCPHIRIVWASNALFLRNSRLPTGARDVSKARSALGGATGRLNFVGLDVERDSKEAIQSILTREKCSALVIATGVSPAFPPDPFGPLKIDLLGE
jgi:hypothetical protein